MSCKHRGRLKEKEHKILSYLKRFIFPATGEIKGFFHIKHESSLQNVKNVYFTHMMRKITKQITSLDYLLQ